MFKVPNQYRIKTGRMSSNDSVGLCGAFMVPYGSHSLAVIATNGEGVTGDDGVEWEHVSVSLNNRCPNWKEMCFIKDLFWDAEDCVMQLHPPKSSYVNNHPNCLHMWRPVQVGIPVPPEIFVGVK